MQARFSRLVQDQLRELPTGARRQILGAIRVQLATFPESGTPLADPIGPGYRQVIRSGYRLIYRYDEELGEIRFYYVARVRRPLPPEDLLRHQAF